MIEEKDKLRFVGIVNYINCIKDLSSSCSSLNGFWRVSVTSFSQVGLSFTLNGMERWLLTATDIE